MAAREHKWGLVLETIHYALARREEVGDRGGAREARVNRDYFRVACSFGFDGSLESTGMVLGRITAHDEHHVGILHVHPAVGHRPAPECWSQT